MNTTKLIYIARFYISNKQVSAYEFLKSMGVSYGRNKKSIS